jgi:hypothetical protein
MRDGWQIPESLQQLLRLLHSEQVQALTTSTVGAAVRGVMGAATGGSGDDGTTAAESFAAILDHALNPKTVCVWEGGWKTIRRRTRTWVPARRNELLLWEFAGPGSYE